MSNFFIYYHIIYNTLLQAFASTIITTILATIFARILWKNDMKKTAQAINTLGNILFVTPTIVICILLINIFPQILYGNCGIILCNSILCLGYCTSNIYNGYQTKIHSLINKKIILYQIPLIQQIRYVELPLIVKFIRTSVLIALLMSCNNFTPAMLLGGINSTNLQVAIYQFYSLDYNPTLLYFCCITQFLLNITIAYCIHNKNDSSSTHINVTIGNNHNKNFYIIIAGLITIFCFFSNIIGFFLFTIVIGLIIGFCVTKLSTIILVFCLLKRNYKYHLINKVSLALYFIPKILLIILISSLLGTYTNSSLNSYVIAFIISIIIYMPYGIYFMLNGISAVNNVFGKSLLLHSLSLAQLIKLIKPYIAMNFQNTYYLISCFTISNITIAIFLGIYDLPLLSMKIYKLILQHDISEANHYALGLWICTLFMYFILGKKIIWKA